LSDKKSQSGSDSPDYEKWLGDNKIKESDDYDTKGAFDAGASPDARGHLPDTYKLPNHITYSDESIYSKEKDAPPPGKWVGDDKKGWEFHASQTNIDNAGGEDKLKDYFKNKEPSAKLVLPESSSTPAPAPDTSDKAKGRLKTLYPTS